ncbi:MAG: hypothetical protein NZ805_00370 [Armatimonadetes bacterium]|nr:hypothetical protein [Armatimonadota bacterium]MDW8026971.1 hypothetical protein [Armatimonadota bacterium]
MQRKLSEIGFQPMQFACQNFDPVATSLFEPNLPSVNRNEIDLEGGQTDEDACGRCELENEQDDW